MSGERAMGSIVFADGSRRTRRDGRLRVVITWPSSGSWGDAHPVSVRDAETGDLLPVYELHVTWTDTGLITAEALMESGEKYLALDVVAMGIEDDPDRSAATHACPECGMRRDYRLEPADGGKFGRPGIALRKRWSCAAGHVQVEDE